MQLPADGGWARNLAAPGGYQAIMFQMEKADAAPALTGDTADSPVNGVYRTASERREDGSAVGW